MFARRCLPMLVLFACAWPGIASAPTDQEKPGLRGELARVVAEAGPDELIPVSIVLADQLEGPRLRAFGGNLADRDRKRAVRIRALKEHAQRTQAGLLAQLRAAESRGAARRIRALWIGNIVAAELTGAEIERVAARPEVDHVNWEPPRPVFLDRQMSIAPPDPVAPFGAPATEATDIECGVSLMRAPDVWNDFGDTGEGAVIAVIDSGVCWTHSDIENQIWVNPGEDLDGDGVVMDPDDQNGIDDDGNGYVDDLIGYDIDNGDNDPNDDNSHGSHVAGTIAGDGTGGFQAGMAPDAKIMVLRVGLQTSDEPDVWEAMQYAAENGADSISMSLGWKHSWDPDRPTWRTNCENTIDLGTAMVIAAGNEGSGNEPDNVRTPGDVPRVITVGAVNCSDAAASFSSRGPVTWQDVPPWNDWPYPPGLVKPDVAGPGVDTRSHNLCSGYSYKSGTSMATPHVAGAVALMVSRNPGLEHDDLKAILEDTAIDLGEAGKDNTYGSGRVDAYEAVVMSATSDGVIRMSPDEVTCNDTLEITVSDVDLQGTGTVDVEVFSNTEPTPETVTLTETSATSGVFKGSIPTTADPAAPDGRISVVDGDVVTARYIDADDGQGGVNVPKTDTSTADCAAPSIDAVQATDITDTAATIRWTTNEAADSRVDYDTTTPPGQTASDPALVTDHAVPLTGLAECTVYYYQVTSADRFGQARTDDNAGRYYRFETLGNFPDIGVAPCHAGQVSLDDDVYACNASVTISVTDLDLNTDTGAVETADVVVSSTSEPGGEIVTVTEDSENSARFTGTIPLDPGPATTGDGRLAVTDGELVTATYHDLDDGTGAEAWPSATASTDCAGPPIDDVRLTFIGSSTATIAWTTAEPATSRVDWGTSPALGSVREDSALVTQHELSISGFGSCDRIWFTVGGTDAHGNAHSLDAGGEPFAFNANLIPGVFWSDDFEQDTGWTLGGEWEIGAPQGLGGGGGNPDPPRAFSGLRSLGDDLSGTGTYAGDYEPNVTDTAVSPRFSCSACQNSVLLFRRQLNAASGDRASLELVGAGDKLLVYDSGGATVRDDGWITERYDVSGFADGQPLLQMVFRQESNASTQYSGWNVDELVLKDGSLPDFSACGGCDGAPSMAGLSSVDDPDACGPGGLTLTWEAASAWGTGNSGSYAVYRDTDPAFVPSPSNLVASGITGTSWTDSAAPVDQQVYYIVRAENDETCSTGPNNGGVMDGNLVRVAGTETVDRPPAGSLGAGLRAEPVNHAHIRLSWDPVSGVAFYRVLRAETPDMSGAQVIAETSDTFYEDAGVYSTAHSYYYRVVAVNACGAETP